MKLSVIVPALNEQRCLAATLEAAKRELEDGDELIVADGGSKDTTAQIAARLVYHVVRSRPGRALQMHTGALRAKGDVLLFLHADTLLPLGWRGQLAKVWDNEPRPALTAFGLRFDAPGAHYRLMELLARWRTRLTGVPQGDQALAVDAKGYLAAGGFPLVPLMEEYELRRHLPGRLKILEGKVRTSARRYQARGPIRNNLRNFLILFLYYTGVPPERLARLYL